LRRDQSRQHPLRPGNAIPLPGCADTPWRHSLDETVDPLTPRHCAAQRGRTTLTPVRTAADFIAGVGRDWWRGCRLVVVVSLGGGGGRRWGGSGGRCVCSRAPWLALVLGPGFGSGDMMIDWVSRGTSVAAQSVAGRPARTQFMPAAVPFGSWSHTPPGVIGMGGQRRGARQHRGITPRDHTAGSHRGITPRDHTAGSHRGITPRRTPRRRGRGAGGGSVG
jgi:hypothetical protein